MDAPVNTLGIRRNEALRPTAGANYHAFLGCSARPPRLNLVFCGVLRRRGWTMDAPTADELQEARRPLASLLGKSEKAQQKLASGTWQHTMLRDNIKALRLALALMNKELPDAGNFSRADLQEALRALASVVGRADEAQLKFSPGTSQHTLQRNRLRALRVAEALIRAELRDREAERSSC